MNCLKLRFSASTHSVRESFCGPAGAAPPACSVVDNAEAAELHSRIALASAAEQQPCSRAHATREEEPDGECSTRHDREVRPHLSGNVGPFADALAERIGSVRELLALELEIAADVVRPAGFVTLPLHRSSMHSSATSPRGSPARAPAASPCESG